MKRIVITGAAGYIGSVLAPYLEQRGYACSAIDAGFFRDALLYPATAPAVRWLDVRDLSEDDLAGADALVHLAAISNDPLNKLDNARVYDPTRRYSLALAQMCKRLGIRFIFASSCSVYGIGAATTLDEAAPTQPQTGYSLNKLQIEQDLQALSDANFSPIALRFATVFGASPRLRFDVVINMFVGMAVADHAIVLNSDGQAWRPHLHILDACAAIHRAIEAEYNDGRLLVLNIGAEENNLRILDLANIVSAAVPGCAIKFLHEEPALDKDGLIADRKIKQGVDTRTYRVAFDKVQRVFAGYRAQWSVERGVADLAARLQQLPLTHELFKARGFYRLQQLEFLHSQGFLSDDLRWRKPPAAS